MAVAPMSRVEVVGYRPILGEVIDELQRVGALELSAAPEGLQTEALEAGSERARLIDEYAADARFVRDFLKRYHRPTQPFSAFVSEKVHMDAAEFESLEHGIELLALYEACEALADDIATAERERARSAETVAALEPWLGVHLQISQWQGTEHTVLIAGTVSAGDALRIRQTLRETTPLVSVAEYGGTGLREAWMVLAHVESADLVRSALAATSFVEVQLPGLSDYPAEESARAGERVGELDARLEELRAQALDLAKTRYHEAVAIVESLESDAAAVAVRRHIGRTERTFVVTGWVRASREDEVLVALDHLSEDLDITFREPAEDETPPVELDNPRWLKPFEVLTDLYGRPGYREIDPTPLLAPFFLLFFAICVGDVGYGAMLALAAWLIKTRLDVAASVKRFCDLMMLGGAAAMVVGVAFRSYFSMDVAWLPAFLRYKPLIDPLADLQTFLIAMIALGIVQVFFGVAVAAYDSFRRGDAGTAVFEQLSTIFLFAMIGLSVAVWGSNPAAGRAALVIGLLGTMLMQGRTFDAALNGKDRPLWDRALGWAWLAGMLAWIASLAFGGPAWILWTLLGVTVAGLVLSTSVRKLVVSFLGGAYAVYGMSSFIGDTLSYARLAALGLSGALVGMVFNILAGLVWGPVAGLASAGGLSWILAAIVALLAAVVFAFGHVFNVVINLLGAFVHPARLQFVEFFSKFYEGGGRPLAPFAFVTRSVVLHAGAGRQEGGAGS